MTQKLCYEIAGLCIRFVSDGPLRDEEKWSRFRCTEERVDHTVCIQWADDLPEPTEPALEETEKICLYPGGLRLFRLRNTAPFHAASYEAYGSTRVTVLHQNAPWGQTPRELFDLLALPNLLIKKDRLLIHGVLIDVQGRGIIFSAPSGVGKTTQAELWVRNRNAVIVNGDRVAVGMENGQLTAWGVPISGSSDDCLNRTLPVRAIVMLSQGSENIVRRLPGKEAFSSLLTAAYFTPTHPKDRQAHYASLLSVAESNRIFSFSCLPDSSAVEALEQVL